MCNHLLFVVFSLALALPDLPNQTSCEGRGRRNPTQDSTTYDDCAEERPNLFETVDRKNTTTHADAYKAEADINTWKVLGQAIVTKISAPAAKREAESKTGLSGSCARTDKRCSASNSEHHDNTCIGNNADKPPREKPTHTRANNHSTLYLELEQPSLLINTIIDILYICLLLLITILNNTNKILDWHLLYSECEQMKHPCFNVASINVGTFIQPRAENLNENYYHKLFTIYEMSDNSVEDRYCHIINLQETAEPTNDTYKVNNQHKFKNHSVYTSNTGEDGNLPKEGSRRGVMTLIDRTWSEFVTKVYRRFNRILIILLDLPGTTITKIAIFNIYMPCEASANDNNTISQYIKEQLTIVQNKGYEVCLCGDWNATSSPLVDRSNNDQRITPESSTLSMIHGHSPKLIDAQKGTITPQQHTHRSHAHQTTSRIDMIFQTRTLDNATQEFKLTDEDAFDHKMLHIKWNLDTNINDIAYNQSINYNYKKATDDQWTLYIQIMERNTHKAIEMMNKLNNYTLHELGINMATNFLHTSMQNALEESIGLKQQTHRTTKLETCCKLQSIVRKLKLLKHNIRKKDYDFISNKITRINKHITKHTDIPEIEDPPAHTNNEMKRLLRVIKYTITQVCYITHKNTFAKIKERIDNRNTNFNHNLGAVLDSILERKRKKLIINKYVTYDTEGNITHIETDPTKVKHHVITEFCKKFKKRITDYTLPHSLRNAYKPDETINERVYINLMEAPTYKELEDAIRNTPDKATGPSKISIQAIKRLPKVHKQLLQSIIAHIYRFGIMPEAWLKGTVYLTPKKEPTWDNNLNDTRPIMLLEILQKICLKILTARLGNIIQTNNICKGNNNSVLKGTSCAEPLALINATLEDARENNKELWILLMDIKRAFDTVDPTILSMCFKRLKIPDQYIKLFEHINANRQANIITAHGCTEYSHLEIGLAQGGVESPLHWLIFYDAIMCHIDKSANGYTLNYTPINNKRNNGLELKRTNVKCFAYVDDTGLAATSHPDLTEITISYKEIADYNKIETHEKKFSLLVLNENPDTTNEEFLYNNTIIPRDPADKGARYLGIHISADGKNKTQKEIIQDELANAVGLLVYKQITEQICRYVINHVILPIISYKSKFVQYTDVEFRTIDSKLNQLFKSKAKLCRSTPNAVLNHPQLYGVNKFKNYHTAAHISSYMNIFNGATIATDALMHREHQLADNRMHGNFTNQINTNARASKGSIISYYHQLLYTVSTTLQHEETRGIQTLDEALRDQNLINEYKQYFKRYKLFYIDQLITADGHSTISWNQLHKTNTRSKIEYWFTHIIQMLAEDNDTSNCRTQNYALKPHLRPSYIRNPCQDDNEHDRENENQPEPDAPRKSRRIANNETVRYPNEIEIAVKLGEAQQHIELDYKYMQKYDHIKLQKRTNSITLNNKLYFNHSLNLEELDNINTPGNLTIFTDGSVTDANNPRVSAGCGILMLKTEDWNTLNTFTTSVEDFANKVNLHPNISLYGEITGHKTSYTAELTGVYQALMILEDHPHITVNIVLDNEAVVKDFEPQITFTKHENNKILRSSGTPHWERIRKLIVCRTGKTRLSWIKGHANHKGNEYADKLASNHGTKRNAWTNTFHTPRMTGSRTLNAMAYTKDGPIEIDVRKFIKHRLEYNISNDFFNSTYQIEHNNIYYPTCTNDKPQEIDWTRTLAIVHGAVKMSSRYSNISITANRTYHMKLITGMLPTLTKLHQRRPLIYKDNICIRCNTHVETNEHVWTCTAARETRQTIFTEAQITLLKKLNPVKQDISEIDEEHMKLIMSIMPIMDQNNKTREEIKDAFKEYVQDKQQYTQEEATRAVTAMEYFNHNHAIRGIVPTLLRVLIETLINDIIDRTKDKSTKSNLRRTFHNIPNLVSQYISEISAKSKERIWKVRCEEVQAWEEEQKITRQQKEAPYSTRLIGPKPMRIKRKRTQARKEQLQDEREDKVKLHIITSRQFIQLVKGHRESDAFTNPNTKIKFTQGMLWKEEKAVTETPDIH